MNRAWNGDLTLQDRVKRCYQRAFGAEHMMADEAAALARLRAECASLSAPGPQETCFEPLGNGLCRLHLRPALAAGLSVETIHRLFVWSAGRPRDGRADFDAALEALAVTDEARALGLRVHAHENAQRISGAQGRMQAVGAFYQADGRGRYAHGRGQGLRMAIVGAIGKRASGR